MKSCALTISVFLLAVSTTVAQHPFAGGSGTEADPWEVATLEQLQAFLKLHPGETPSLICLQYDDGRSVVIKAGKSFAVTPGPEFVREYASRFGAQSLSLAVSREPYRNGNRQSTRRGSYRD